MTKENITQVTIVGGGFTGLSAGYELAKKGIKVEILESEDEIGGLAAAFNVNGEKLDRFYHHWFTNDHDVMRLIDELNLKDKIQINPTNTGIYYANNFYKLSTPWDLLKFSPLRIFDRIRLGLLTLRARRVKNWQELESKTAQEWLKELGGGNVYNVVWQPLLKGKFGPYSDKISAVWFWNKLKLRGGSRGKNGEERLVYFKGGFIELANALAREIEKLGGKIHLKTKVNNITPHGKIWETSTNSGVFNSERVLVTTSLPLIADMINSWAPDDYLNKLNRINYIGNVCLVLVLERPLSETYWLNVNDPSFPFVGVIEHTNFESPDSYGGKHIVYLSKYLPHTDKLYSMDKNELLEYALPYIQRMFPQFNKSWISEHHLWKARWSQPVVEKEYSKLIPATEGPEEGFHICSMAQIYPEDRGTNYAIREGKLIAENISKHFK